MPKMERVWECSVIENRVNKSRVNCSYGSRTRLAIASNKLVNRSKLAELELVGIIFINHLRTGVTPLGAHGARHTFE